MLDLVRRLGHCPLRIFFQGESRRNVQGVTMLKIIATLTVGSWLILSSSGIALAAPYNSDVQKPKQGATEASRVGDKHNEASAPAMRSGVPRSDVVSWGVRDWIGVFKDIFLAVAALIGSCAAWLGLSTWNRQLIGNTEYDLARRILPLCYRYRDAIRGVRARIVLQGPLGDTAARRE